MTSSQGPGALRTEAIQFSPEQLSSLLSATAAVTHLPLVPVVDWATRAARALIAGDLDAASTVAIINRPQGRVEQVGSSRTPSSWPLMTQPIDHDLHLRSLANHNGTASARLVDWLDMTDHPFARGGLARGSVATATAPIADGYHLCAFRWQGLTEPAPIHLGALEATVRHIAVQARELIPPAEKPLDWLSARETEVLDLILLGHTVPQIGLALSRSPNTIHDHLKAIHRKSRVKTRGELVAAAMGRRVAREAAE